MSRTALLLAVALALAGCVGGLGPTSPTESVASPTGTDAPTDSRSGTPTPRESVRVHYVLDVGGGALDDFRSVNVTIRSVAFREGTGSQCHGPLYPEDTTLTPTKTPDLDRGLDCVVFETNRTLDLTEHREALSLGAYTVPEVVADDTFVVVVPHGGTLENGTQVQFDPTDPGFALDPRAEGEVRRVGIAVDAYRSGYGVGPDGPTGSADVTPAAEYAVGVDGRIRNGESVTVSVARDGDSLSGHAISVDGRTATTGSDGSVSVEVSNARVFEIAVPVNVSSA